MNEIVSAETAWNIYLGLIVVPLIIINVFDTAARMRAAGVEYKTSMASLKKEPSPPRDEALQATGRQIRWWRQALRFTGAMSCFFMLLALFQAQWNYAIPFFGFAVVSAIMDNTVKHTQQRIVDLA